MNTNHDQKELDRILMDIGSVVLDHPEISQPIMQMTIHRLLKDYRRCVAIEKVDNQYPRPSYRHDVYRC